MRFFVALDIEEQIRSRIAQFRDEMRALAPDVRWVGPETFHITLQFLGETKKADEIKRALGSVSTSTVTLSLRGAGFFPTPQRARVFWVGIEADPNLRTLVDEIGRTLAPLGFERDKGEYHPHLTLARAGSGRPHSRPGDRPAPGLQQVRQKLEGRPQPEFGTMTAHEFYLYESKLSPSGARYTKLAKYSLS